MPRPAAAEWHFTPMLGLTFKGDTNFLDWERTTADRHRNFGGAVSRLGDGILGAEAILTLTPGFFQGGVPANPDEDLVELSRSVSLMGNVVLTTPRLWTEYSLRPFVSAGFGMLHVRAEPPRGAVVLPVDATMPGFNVGGGAIGFLSNRTGIRFEMRYLRAVGRPEFELMTRDGGPARLRYITASIGVVIRTGVR